ncbi:MAG TPA: hypothetical protein VMT93_01680 [Gemmatimonadaceae bacterium]|nr:hypothetical protein [Gemmatimonadaceae bacterium]
MALNVPGPSHSHIAGSVLPIKRAEELLLSLPGVLSARIIAAEDGAVSEIHMLTTAEVDPKRTVRNVESALIAHLGMKVDHRKISIAQSVDPVPPREKAREESAAAVQDVIRRETLPSRMIYFEDVEVRRSRVRGVTCRVTLRKGEASYSGEAEGAETERSRAELAARAALLAIAQAETEAQFVAVEGCKMFEAFDAEFVFVGISARSGRERVLLTGSCMVKESPETASVLAVLDATNRWLGRTH